MRRAALALLGTGCAQLLGITDPNGGSGSGDGGAPTSEHIDVPATANRDLDLLFVIDDSPSMADKQQNLADNFPNLISDLNQVTGGLPNLHLGVVTSDLGTTAADGQIGPAIGNGPSSCSGSGKGGKLQVGQVSAGVLNGTFISDVDGGGGLRTKNYTGNLSDVFAAMAHVGDTGCGFEQHLQAAKVALAPGTNTGFLRSSAILAIVILGDEDDCSAQHISLFSTALNPLGPLSSFRCTRFGVTCDQGGATPDDMNTPGAKTGCHSNDSNAQLTSAGDYVEFFKGLKADPSQVIVAAIAGTPTPVSTELDVPPGGGAAVPTLAHSCNFTDASGLSVADPAVRIKQVVDAFPGRGAFSTICQQNLSDPLLTVGEQIRAATGGTACFTGNLADGDTVTPGIQPTCTVADVVGVDSVPLPECDAGATNVPCWQVVQDAAQCPAGGHFELEVQRTVSAPSNDHVVADCAL